MKLHLGWVLTAVAMATACGGSDSSSPTPTTPVSTTTATANGSAGTTTSDGKTGGTSGTAATPPAVLVTGIVSALGGSCPTITFTLATKSIKTDASTKYGSTTCGEIKNGVTAGASGAVQADGSVLAKEVRIMPPPPPPPATAFGTVSARAGTCPAISFKLDGKAVKTDGSTKYGDKTCSDITDGIKAGASGVAQADGSILAKEVRVVPPPPPPPVFVTGTVSARAGACTPSVTLTFKIESKTIKADASTKFGDKKCADIVDGIKVGVSGTAQADGSVLAKEVRLIPPPPPPPASALGTLSDLGGACPAIVFKLDGKVVKTDAATKYGDKTCADIKKDLKVGAMGTLQSDGSILAKEVRIIPPPPPAPLPPVILGTVTVLSGACPALTITVGSKVATTTDKTVFDGKKCSDIKVGTTVGIYGATAVGSTTLAATKVVIR